MRSETRSPDLPRALLLGVCALLLVGGACAEDGRPVQFVRPQTVPPERHAREMPNFGADFLRNQAQEENRAPPRRWSPEERQQLRRDVHEAGRDVYGGSPGGNPRRE